MQIWMLILVFHSTATRVFELEVMVRHFEISKFSNIRVKV